jgi:hypothetical protein
MKRFFSDIAIRWDTDGNGIILNSAASICYLHQLKLNEMQLQIEMKWQKCRRYCGHVEYRTIYFSEGGLYVRMSEICVALQMTVSRKLTAVRTSYTNGEKFVTITTLWGLLITLRSSMWIQSNATSNVCVHRLVTTELTDVRYLSVFGMCLLHIPAVQF